MKTRLAKNSDYNKINELLVILHNYHSKYEPSHFNKIYTYYENKDEYKKYLKNKDYIHLVATKNSIVVGILIIKLRTIDDIRRLPTVEAIIIYKKFRNKNYGKKLLIDFIEYYKYNHKLISMDI